MVLLDMEGPWTKADGVRPDDRPEGNAMDRASAAKKSVGRLGDR